MKVFTEEEKKVFIHFSREEMGQTHGVGVDTEGFEFESFTEFQRARYGERGGFMSDLAHSSIQAGCFSIGCDFLENRLTVFRNFPILGCLKDLIVALNRCSSILNNVEFTHSFSQPQILSRKAVTSHCFSGSLFSVGWFQKHSSYHGRPKTERDRKNQRKPDPTYSYSPQTMLNFDSASYSEI